MKPLSRNRTNARWPFWLLLAAWVCANSPQVAVYTAIAWIGEARHFTHQQRLTAEVAHVLTGVKTPSVLAAIRQVPLRPLAPVVPAEATLKKIELAIARTVDLLGPVLPEKIGQGKERAMPDARTEAPPHEPPRVGRVV